MKRSAIEPLLPEVFQRTLKPGSPLSEILSVMEALHTPAEQALDILESHFNPYRAPDRFVSFLARWMDLDRLFPRYNDEAENSSSPNPPISTGLGRLRELIRATIYLSQWRGTAKGLQLFLETATGKRGFIIDEEVPDSDGFIRPFHIRVRVPHSIASHRTLIERIIEQEKPAYVTHELDFDTSGDETDD